MSKFGGAPKCPVCGKSVYPAERTTYNTKDYHKACLRCSVCKKTLSASQCVGDKGVIYCMNDYKKVQASEAARIASEAEAAAAAAPPMQQEQPQEYQQEEVPQEAPQEEEQQQ